VVAADNWFEVHESALEAFAKTSDSRCRQLEQYLEQAKQLAVSPDAFGHIPFIGARVYQAYNQHVTESIDGLAAAGIVMALNSLAIMTAVAKYQQAEDHVLHLDHLAFEHVEHVRHVEHELHLGDGAGTQEPPA
jgi:hypothetical protein